MSHSIEAAKSGRAKCATCNETISKGATRVAELYQDSTHGRPMYDERYRGDGSYARQRSEHREAIQRFHHLQCAVDHHPAVVATALKRPHDPALIENRKELDERLSIALEAERKARVAAATARMAPPVEAAAEDPNLTPLLEQLADDPENAELVAIIGDLYQARNDPRGELIAIQLGLRIATYAAPEVANPRGRTRAQPVEDMTTKNLGARRDQLITQLTPKLPDNVDLSLWGLGFIRRVEIGRRTAAGIQEISGLWRHASLRVLSELRLELPGSVDDAATIAHLAELLPRSLRILELAGSATAAATIQPILAALPRLADLTFLGRLPDPSLTHAGLASITIAGQSSNVAPSSAVAFLRPEHLPAVRRLVLRDWMFDRDPLAELARSQWLAVIDHLVIDKPYTEQTQQMPLAWAATLAEALGDRKLKRLEITTMPIPLPVRAALTPLCDELICPAHAVVLDDATTHVMHANKPEWGRGKIIKRANGKLEVKFGKEVKVFKADAPFLVPAPAD